LRGEKGRGGKKHRKKVSKKKTLLMKSEIEWVGSVKQNISSHSGNGELGNKSGIGGFGGKKRGKKFICLQVTGGSCEVQWGGLCVGGRAAQRLKDLIGTAN